MWPFTVEVAILCVPVRLFPSGHVTRQCEYEVNYALKVSSLTYSMEARLVGIRPLSLLVEDRWDKTHTPAPINTVVIYKNKKHTSTPLVKISGFLSSNPPHPHNLPDCRLSHTDQYIIILHIPTSGLIYVWVDLRDPYIDDWYKGVVVREWLRLMMRIPL